ncbi:Periplasmic chaperone Spy [Commensalibacter communis]|uniref:Spy/CpxP family protein refolding chaperone n=1 Tax=Commensalibacter communis TaxID=2972786 RepID=UPI0022FF9F17|nr:Spy/CpxP family protein refolding chaperone [Commensalibacter communis]CAI3926279.1 Periplasmic chaperone Spy [Commensalibacter communis]CAI3932874.1 Periplasmic chaperone Spy [Commensalibacter communis]
MFNKKMLSSMVVASGLSLGAIGAAFAHPEAPPPPPPGELLPPPPPHRPGGMFGPAVGPMGMIFQGVKLTKEQKQKIHDIIDAARKEEKTNREAMKSIHDQMATALLSPGKVTDETLKPILEKQAVLEKTTKESHLKTILALRDVLTPEQLAKAKVRYTKIKSIREQMKELREMDAPPPEDAPSLPSEP